MQTLKGNKFDFDEPRNNKYDIEEIAHALSMKCRFNGHCHTFYSEADHQH